MEDMLIARVKSYTQVRWTKRQQSCYQDHIVNFSRHVTEIATRLPHLPDGTDMVIICKEDVDLSGHVDFMVRREKVKAALEYKIAHDPNYEDLVIDHGVLSQLPENGSLVDRIPTCREGRQDGGGAMPVGPPGAAAADENEYEQVVGGVLDLGVQQRLEVDHLRRGAAQVFSGTRYEQTVVCFHKHTPPFFFFFYTVR
jgi:hypothetical protein